MFDPHTTQPFLYETSIKACIPAIFQGFNLTILAYGQTGTGKTFTMEGTSENPGLLPRTAREIFEFSRDFSVKVSALQIYNENIHDLLSEKPEKANLLVREDKRTGVFVEGLCEFFVNTQQELLELLKKAAKARSTGSTRLNDVSSRSHAIFTVSVSESEELVENSKKIRRVSCGKLNFVDLAGSERARSSGTTGKRLEETKKINQSLSALGNVISALADNKGSCKGHVPYRDSKVSEENFY